MMAQNPKTTQHEKQIRAGAVGRNNGHRFEEHLAALLNSIDVSQDKSYLLQSPNLYKGNPALSLIHHIESSKQIRINKVKAWWLGGLATGCSGDCLIDCDGNIVEKCKSDVVVDIYTNQGLERIGVSVKNCSRKKPTNDQIYFTTAAAFCELLIKNGINVPEEARIGMSKFCGDINYRPIDLLSEKQLLERSPNNERYFWEELDSVARDQWANIFTKHQNYITRLLLQKAYKNDPYPPTYLVHATRCPDGSDPQETAIFTIDEIVKKSSQYSSFEFKDYKINKGRFKNDTFIHKAPSFGYIQFQRAGTKQNPTQLQFNLKAGYFYL